MAAMATRPGQVKFEAADAPSKTPQAEGAGKALVTQVTDLKAELEKSKAEKKAQKAQIQTWLDEFKRSRGREATKEDKEQVRPMFNVYKELERKCKELTAELEPLEAKLAKASAGSLAELEPRIKTLEAQLEKKTADRKAQKHRIQDWLDDFKRTYGREASKKDKEQVRPMFNKYKELEREARELGDELTELKRQQKELQAQEAAQTKRDGLGLTRAPSALDASGQGSVMAKTTAMGEEAAGARMNQLQERFAKLALQQEQLAGIEQDLMADTEAIPIRRAESAVGLSVAGEEMGGGMTRAMSGMLDGSASANSSTTALGGEATGRPAALTPILGLETKAEPEDDGTRFGLGSLFEKDARRDDRFLDEEADIPMPRLVDLHDVVLDLRQTLATEPMPDFLGEFQEKLPAEEVVIAKIPVEEVEKRERLIEEVRVQHAKAEADRYKKRELDLAWREHISRGRITEMEREAWERIELERRKVVDENLANERALQRHFVAAKERLEKLIYSQKAHFTEKYGTIEPGQLAVARRFHINWDYEPQPIEMRVHLMRAAKNKLPAGRYCILVTPYERLGGHPITWSKLSFQGMGHHRPQATRPVRHKGRFFDTTIRIDQSVFALCPSRKQVRPSNCLIVEVFYLAGKDNPKDQIVGWGVLPMCNPRFRVVQGRFKIPLLKGEPTPLIDKYGQIESLLIDDLTHWLCNIYVDVRHLSKEHLDRDGKLHREYDLEVDYVNRQLLLGPRPKALKELDKKEQKAAAKQQKRKAEPADEEAALTYADERPRTDEQRRSATDPSHPSYKHSGWAPQSNETWFEKREKLFRHPPRAAKRKGNKRQDSGSQQQAQDMLSLASPTSADGKRRVNFSGDIEAGLTPHSPGADTTVSLGSTYDQKEHDEEEAEDDESSSSDDEEEAKSSGDEWVLDGGETRPLLMNKEMGLPAAGQQRDGRGKMRRRRQEGSRWDADGLAIQSTTIQPDEGKDGAKKGKGGRRGSKVSQSVTKLGTTTRRFEDGVEKLEWFKLSDPQEMEYYSQAVAEDPTKMEKPLPQEIVRSKLLYLKTELLADLGFKNWRSTEFWVTVVIFTFMFWLRMYLHYLGQYLYLWARGVAVYTFDASLYCMKLKYISSTYPASQEIAVVLMGPLANILVFLGLSTAGWGMMKSIGNIPDSTSKAIAAFGIASMLDPFLIFVVDVLASHYNCSLVSGCEVNYTAASCRCYTGDAFKLYERFTTDENNGVAGAFITLIVYLAEFLVAGFCLYNYLIYIHMNGRMLDVFKRLHGTSEDFFTPHDFEVTYAELAYICDKARKWTHPRGTRRRIAVCDYELTDPLEPEFAKEVTTHLTIYNLEIDGSKTLYRHFLRMPDGTIIELFDVVAKSLGSQFDSLEKLLLSDQNVSGASARGFFSNFLS